jgi:hypothetical protein
MTIETRQMRRARQREEAKRQASAAKANHTAGTVSDRDIEQAKRACPAGFQLDAGLYSRTTEDNQYWFQLGEWFNTVVHMQKAVGHSGVRGYYDPALGHIHEVGFSVDIMDSQAKSHRAPQQEQGYLATVILTRDHAEALADVIALGGMTVRITGRPYGNIQRSPTGERFRLILPTAFYSAGNQAGNMRFHTLGGSIDSKGLSRFFKETITA